MRLAVAAGALALAVAGCSDSVTPQQKMTSACQRMNKETGVPTDCACIVGRLRQKLSDNELSALADAVNDVLAKTGGEREAVGMELGLRINNRELVSGKVGDEFFATQRVCWRPQTVPPAPVPPAAPPAAPAP